MPKTPIVPARPARPLLVAGPCVIEDPEATLASAEVLARAAVQHGFSFVFKASFDKANRTAGASYRGPGMDEGLEVLRRVKEEQGLVVLTDIHSPDQAEPTAQVVDVLQIPAFLCRQTDLLAATAATGKPVNLKKGPFLAPNQVQPAVEKLRSAGGTKVWITERGSSFGHGDLVVDFRSLALLRETGCPLLIDASHAAQQPGARRNRSGGQRAWVPILARAAAGAGFHGLYLEVHPKPEEALSDNDTQWPLDRVGEILGAFASLWKVSRALDSSNEPPAGA